MKQNHINAKCFHCKKEFEQRKDTVKRQSFLYGHSCCKNCFGKEKTFKDARAKVMTNSNPFKGKHHTEETKKKLSLIKIGSKAWNKGLTKYTDKSVRVGSEKSAAYMKGRYIGNKNPNWKGGISDNAKYMKGYRFSPKYAKFRAQILMEDKTCWVCVSNIDLQLHHMASRKRYPDKEMDELNCITLCKICHKEFHRIYGVKRFEPSHTIEWINSKRDLKDKLQMC